MELLNELLKYAPFSFRLDYFICRSLFEFRSAFTSIGRLKEYSTEVWALLDSEAVPDVISTNLSHRLYLSTQCTSKIINFPKGDSSSYVFSLLTVPTTFRHQAVKLHSFFVEKSPLDIIIGLPTLSAMRENIDFVALCVSLQIGSEKVVLLLELDTKYTKKKLVKGENIETPSEDFTHIRFKRWPGVLGLIGRTGPGYPRR